MENIKYFFDYFSKNHHAAIIFWVVFGIILTKLCEAFLHESLVEKGYFQGNKEKIVWFEVLLVGLVLLLSTILSDILFKANFMWYVISLSAVIGGILGLLPFSFSKKKK